MLSTRSFVMKNMATKLAISPVETAAKCLACQVRYEGICAVLSPQELGKIGPKTTRREFKAGAPIFFEGDDVRSHGNIVSGVVHLSKGLSDGRQQIVGLLFSPSLLPARVSKVTAQAATDSEICSIPNSVLNEILGDNPKIEDAMYRQTLDELDDTRHWMLSIGRKTALEKIASLILMFVLRSNSNTASGGSFDLPLTRAEIADFLGLTIETVSRNLTKLRSSHIITIDHGRTVSVNNLSGLKKAAGD